MKNIYSYQSSEENRDALRKRTKKLRKSKSCGTLLVDKNKRAVQCMSPKDYNETKNSHFDQVYEKENEKQQKAKQFRRKVSSEQESKNLCAFFERIASQRIEEAAKRIAFRLAEKKRKNRGHILWQKLLLQKHKLEQLRHIHLQRKNAAIKLQRAWRRYSVLNKIQSLTKEALEQRRLQTRLGRLQKKHGRILLAFLNERGMHTIKNKVQFTISKGVFKGNVIKIQKWWRTRFYRKVLQIAQASLQWKTIEISMLEEEKKREVENCPAKTTHQAWKKCKLKLSTIPVIKNSRRCLKKTAVRITKSKRQEMLLKEYIIKREKFKKKMREHFEEVIEIKKQNVMKLRMNEMRLELGLPPDSKYSIETENIPVFTLEFTEQEIRQLVYKCREVIRNQRLQAIKRAVRLNEKRATYVRERSSEHYSTA